MVLILLIFLGQFTSDTGSEKLIDKYFDKVEDYYEDQDISLEEFSLLPINESVKEFYSVQSADENVESYILISQVAACSLGGCSALSEKNKTLSSEYFDLLVILDKDKNIEYLKILDYFSDYGYEVTSKRYLKKFKNKNVCSFFEETDGIDAISGATVSSQALEYTLSLLCDQEG